MKKIVLILLSIAFTFNACTQAQTKSKTKNEKEKTVTVYYFHATNRCPTCLAIEANTKKTVETYFANELKAGTLKFIVINVDEDKNKKLAEKYEAAGAALILAKTVNVKETKTDMTDFAFSYARNNTEKFMNGLKNKIQELLK